MSSFCVKLPPLDTTGACIYVLDCRKTFRALLRVLGAVERDEKKFVAGLAWWKARTGADLDADFDTSDTADVSRSGCRIVNAILIPVSSKLCCCS